MSTSGNLPALGPRADPLLGASGISKTYRQGVWPFERADRLSGGTLAKLNLALALLPDPMVLLLDEPYAGFDWDTYLRFWEMVGRRRKSGRAVLVISHFIADEERFDRIIELSDGKARQKRGPSPSSLGDSSSSTSATRSTCWCWY